MKGRDLIIETEQIRILMEKIKEIDKKIAFLEMNIEILTLTTRDRVDHELIYNGNHENDVACMNGCEYEKRASELRDRKFCIRKTFQKGQWELWIKHER